MLLKIDTKMKEAMEEREDSVQQIARSTKMYGWDKSDDVGEIFDEFTMANPLATLADLMNWSKRTRIERMKARKHSLPFNNYRVDIFDNPRTAAAQREQRNVEMIDDVVQARPKVHSFPKRDQPAETQAPIKGPEKNPGPEVADIARMPSLEEISNLPKDQPDAIGPSDGGEVEKLKHPLDM